MAAEEEIRIKVEPKEEDSEQEDNLEKSETKTEKRIDIVVQKLEQRRGINLAEQNNQNADVKDKNEKELEEAPLFVAVKSEFQYYGEDEREGMCDEEDRHNQEVENVVVKIEPTYYDDEDDQHPLQEEYLTRQPVSPTKPLRPRQAHKRPKDDSDEEYLPRGTPKRRGVVNVKKTYTTKAKTTDDGTDDGHLDASPDSPSSLRPHEVFNEEEDEILITLVSQHPLIYDLSIDEYKNTRKKEVVWAAIAKALNKRSDSCKKHWKNLKDTYLRQKRKHGSIAPKNPRSKFGQYMNLFSFLESVSFERSSVNNNSNDENAQDPDDKPLSQCIPILPPTAGSIQLCYGSFEEIEAAKNAGRIEELFTEEEDEVLVTLVSQHPLIYDLSREDYKNTRKKEQVWAEIGATLNKRGDACKKHWKNIKDTYLRQKRRYERTGKSASKNPRSKFGHYNKLFSFLETVPFERSSIINNASDENTTVDSEDRSLSQDDAISTDPTVKSSNRSIAKHNRRLSKKNILTYLQKRELSRQKMLQHASDKPFSDYVKITLKRLSASRKMEAKKEILDILAKYEMDVESDTRSGAVGSVETGEDCTPEPRDSSNSYELVSVTTDNVPIVYSPQAAVEE